MNKIEFNTIDYEFSHGHSPRGRGSWAFSLRNPATVYWSVGDAIFLPDSMTFSEARREFSRVARMFGVSGTAWVCS